MLIVWGTKIKEKRLGRVAEFCVICREMRAHRVISVRAAGHVYGISLTQGELLGHQTECESCHVRVDTEIRNFTKLSQDKFADVTLLASETFPDYEQVNAEHLRFEAMLRNGTLSEEDRATSMLERLYLLDTELERHRARPETTPLGKKVGWAVLAAGVALFGSIALMTDSAPSEDPIWILVMMGILIIGFVLFVILMGFRTPWYMKNRLRPQLVRALAPLKPTVDELSEALARCRESDLRIGKKIKAPKLYAWIEEEIALGHLKRRDA